MGNEVMVLLFLFLVGGFAVIAVRLRTLTRELKQTNSLIVAQIAEPAPAKLQDHTDPVVHDFHSDNDEYASVTGRAQGDW